MQLQVQKLNIGTLLKELCENVALQDKLFYILFTILYTRAFIYTTMFTSIINTKILNLIGYAAAACLLPLAAINIYESRRDWRWTLLLSILLFSGFASAVFGGDRTVVIFCVLIVSSIGRKFDVIARISLVIGIMLMIAAYLASMNGYIPYLVYFGHEGMYAHAFGSVYRTDFASHVFFLVMTYVWLKNDRIMLFEYVSLWIINDLTWRYTVARMNTICLSVFLVCYGIIILHSKVRAINSSFKELVIPTWTAGIHFLCVLVTFILVNFIGGATKYEEIEEAMLGNSSFVGRLGLSAEGIKKYGISLFGRMIEERGNGGIVDVSKQYFFLDITYVRILLKFGIVFFLMYLFWMSMMSYYASVNRDTIMVLILAMIAIVSLIEHHATDFSYNVFCLAPVLFGNRCIKRMKVANA